MVCKPTFVFNVRHLVKLKNINTALKGYLNKEWELGTRFQKQKSCMYNGRHIWDREAQWMARARAICILGNVDGG